MSLSDQGLGLMKGQWGNDAGGISAHGFSSATAFCTSTPIFRHRASITCFWRVVCRVRDDSSAVDGLTPSGSEGVLERCRALNSGNSV